MATFKRVLIMAGGTGGHVFPGLAVAEYLKSQHIEVHWLGTKQGLEARVIPEANIPFHSIEISGLRGKGIKTVLSAPIKMIKALREARKIIKEVNPDVVIGMGGFVSGPGGVASWLMQRPLVIHEQNAKAGLTNKLLSRIAKKVLEGFPEAFKQQANILYVGNPVRSEIEKIHPPRERPQKSPTQFNLLVLGGSLGAKALNEIIPKTLAKLERNIRPQIMHQTGDKHFDETKKIYESMGIEVTLLPFIKEMERVYSWADMVICRAGALTVAELCSAGVGAIFVPFPFAVDDHQTANANFMVKNSAALCIQQKELTEDRLADIIKEFAQSPDKRLAMAEAAYRLRHIEVPKKIFDILIEVVNSNH